MNIKKLVYMKLRFVMSFIFLWAFFDKTFGLGFATKSADSWINGGSPTHGFLTFATKGPLASFFHSLASMSPVLDWVFMAGLLFIGLTLLLNKWVFYGCLAGIAMMVLMWLSLLWPANNPIVDEHIVYALVFALLAIRYKETR